MGHHARRVRGMSSIQAHAANEKGEGTSGDGSKVRNAAPYMKFLQDFIKKNYSLFNSKDFISQLS